MGCKGEVQQKKCDGGIKIRKPDIRPVYIVMNDWLKCFLKTYFILLIIQLKSRTGTEFLIQYDTESIITDWHKAITDTIRQLVSQTDVQTF